MGYLSCLLGHAHNHDKRRPLQTVELRVRMDCDGCELKVKKALSYMKGISLSLSHNHEKILGVQSVEINRKQSKVTVTGYVELNKVLRRVQSTGKKAEIWPYVPYNLVRQPYVAGTYDKRAPPGYVRNMEAISVQSHAIRDKEDFTNLFSDDNPNACSIM